MLCTDTEVKRISLSEHNGQELQLGCTFSFEKLLGNIQLWFVLRHTEKWKEEFRASLRKHWEEYQDKMLRSFVSCRVLEKEDVGKRKWEEDERKEELEEDKRKGKEARKRVKCLLFQAWQEKEERERKANEEQPQQEADEEQEEGNEEADEEKKKEKESGQAEKEQEKD